MKFKLNNNNKNKIMLWKTQTTNQPTRQYITLRYYPNCVNTFTFTWDGEIMRRQNWDHFFVHVCVIHIAHSLLFFSYFFSSSSSFHFALFIYEPIGWRQKLSTCTHTYTNTHIHTQRERNERQFFSLYCCIQIPTEFDLNYLSHSP